MRAPLPASDRVKKRRDSLKRSGSLLAGYLYKAKSREERTMNRHISDEQTPIGTTHASELGEDAGRGERARPKTDEVADQLKNTARALGHEAISQARSRGEQQKARAADEIDRLASVLHDAGATLDREKMATGRLVHAAADRLEDFVDRLDRRDVDGIIRDARQWARRNPAAFLGGAVALGFVASRFLKASSDDSEWEGDGYDDSFPENLPGSAGYGLESGVGRGELDTTPGVRSSGDGVNPAGRTTAPRRGDGRE
jgi:hypothetical protein